MKKLISDLESAVENYKLNFGGTQYDDGMVSGFETAIEIVKSYDPWIPISKLPPRDESEPNFSIDVMVTNGEGYRLGYYAFRTESWILHKYFRGAQPSHWTFLPEAKL